MWRYCCGDNVILSLEIAANKRTDQMGILSPGETSIRWMISANIGYNIIPMVTFVSFVSLLFKNVEINIYIELK